MEKTTSDEIDLGQLFKLIGNTFNKFFQFIGNIFKNTFHFFILFLGFIRKHIIKFGIAVVAGVVFGAYLDYTSLPIYKSSMIIEPNFNSAQQLYNNIEFYGELAKEEESEALAEALGITIEEAKYIKKVTIESFSDQTQKIKQFSEFISELDSISQKQVDYNDYLENFNNINAKFHKIEIEATVPGVAKKSQESIVKSIGDNEYFTLQKAINDRNITINDSIVIQQQNEVMDLQAFYKKLKILEAQSPNNSATSINLGKNQVAENTVEIELLNQAMKLKEERISINKEKANTKNTINIISEFPNKGVLVNKILYKKIVQVPIACIAIVFLVLILIGLNKYLANYNHQHDLVVSERKEKHSTPISNGVKRPIGRVHSKN